MKPDGADSEVIKVLISVDLEALAADFPNASTDIECPTDLNEHGLDKYIFMVASRDYLDMAGPKDGRHVDPENLPGGGFGTSKLRVMLSPERVIHCTISSLQPSTYGVLLRRFVTQNPPERQVLSPASIAVVAVRVRVMDPDAPDHPEDAIITVEQVRHLWKIAALGQGRARCRLTFEVCDTNAAVPPVIGYFTYDWPVRVSAGPAGPKAAHLVA